MAKSDDLYAVFRSLYDKIRGGIKISPDDVASKLYARSLIDVETENKATNDALSRGQRATCLVQALDPLVRDNPERLRTIVEVFEETPELCGLVDALHEHVPRRQQPDPRVETRQHQPASSGEQPAVWVPGTLSAPIYTPSEQPGLDDLLEHYGIEEATLNKECSDPFLTDVAEKMRVLRCADLNLDTAEPVDDNTARGRLALLKQWRDRSVSNATHADLVRRLHVTGKMDLINAVCLALSSTPSMAVDGGSGDGSCSPHDAQSIALPFPAAALSLATSAPSPATLTAGPVQVAPLNRESPATNSSPESRDSFHSTHSDLSEKHQEMKERVRLLEQDVAQKEAEMQTLEQEKDREIDRLGREVEQKSEAMQSARQEVERLRQAVAELEKHSSRENEKKEYLERCLDITKKRLARVEQEKCKLMDEHDKAVEETRLLKRERDELHSRAFDYEIETEELRMKIKLVTQS